MSEMSRISVGVDSVSTDDVAESIRTFGSRYLDRVYTAREQDACAGELSVRSRSLAGRFAAKEATMKALEPDALVPIWLHIEVFRKPSGACEITLSGTAKDLADARGITQLAVSMTHERNLATAVVIATTEGTVNYDR
jgi:holo-[acyl-carrier protein] synthase